MGLRANIFKHAGCDYSNGGVSGRAEQVTIVNIDGPADPSPEAPAVLLISGHRPGTAVAVPLGSGDTDPEQRVIGAMFGGCFIASSDSRFHEAMAAVGAAGDCAVPLHDRFETTTLYDQLSN